MSSLIRPYHPSDISSYYRICLQTGASGKDATHLYKDADLLGQFYAAPYAVLESDICFTLCCLETPCGYIIGTRNSDQFYQRCETDWFPVLRKRYPLPEPDDTSTDAHIIRLIHQGHQANPDLKAYPAHLHIDILPQGQGKGMGRQLISTFLQRLQEIGTPAVHLQVGKTKYWRHSVLPAYGLSYYPGI